MRAGSGRANPQVGAGRGSAHNFAPARALAIDWRVILGQGKFTALDHRKVEREAREASRRGSRQAKWPA